MAPGATDVAGEDTASSGASWQLVEPPKPGEAPDTFSPRLAPGDNEVSRLLLAGGWQCAACGFLNKGEDRFCTYVVHEQVNEAGTKGQARFCRSTKARVLLNVGSDGQMS